MTAEEIQDLGLATLQEVVIGRLDIFDLDSPGVERLIESALNGVGLKCLHITLYEGNERRIVVYVDDGRHSDDGVRIELSAS